jgi:hypothetical protein
MEQKALLNLSKIEQNHGLNSFYRIALAIKRLGQKILSLKIQNAKNVNLGIMYLLIGISQGLL